MPNYAGNSATQENAFMTVNKSVRDALNLILKCWGVEKDKCSNQRIGANSRRFNLKRWEFRAKGCSGILGGVVCVVFVVFIGVCGEFGLYGVWCVLYVVLGILYTCDVLLVGRVGHPFFSKEHNILPFFCVLFKRTKRYLRSFPFFIKECSVLCLFFLFFIIECSILCVLLRSLQKNVAFFAFFYVLKRSFGSHKSTKTWKKNVKERCVL